jgi:SAM-dependent methyltransferase
MDAYAVSAEFYDVLQARDEHIRAERLFASPARRARSGIVEVGAGSGLVTQVLARAASVPVHAIEPDPAMRALLMSRLASAPPEQRARVTVHPERVQELWPKDHAPRADLAVCSNVIATRAPEQRRATWAALARLVGPDGLLLIDPPPCALPQGPRTQVLPQVGVGDDVYSGFFSETPLLGGTPEADRIHLDYTYQVHRDGELLREEHEEFDLWPIPGDALRQELADAGWRVCEPEPASARPELLTARLGCAAGGAESEGAQGGRLDADEDPGADREPDPDPDPDAPLAACDTYG